ncbi:hypothetical protein BT1A1_1376 [Caldibacillus thermoamylovorans]|uniref:Uncharacterized protein n=1 Tax=Caldibacillus thermoamylovorans TaxID=35841 RepID=A0A090IT00_9BACI|nr:MULTISPECIES: DUF2187 family protein [Bacillaceae]MCM3476216.1 YkvS family protein [Caldibacillus thermoamylovorans]MED3645097.1 DUF2187 family protein [Caldifermentibacillus hisashii]CEE01206.1 hypothetical protein BT1A1_1376 [Caldibacillus thermoamylovorans]
MEQETVTKGNLEGKRKKAKEGDMVEVKRGRYKGKKGEVLIVKENSVIIQLGINPKTGEPVKTVVNHKNYKQVK